MGSAAGLTVAGLKRLHAAAERHVGDEKVPGLVALVARGGQVYVETRRSPESRGRHRCSPQPRPWS